jgi:hypothetical protein
MDAKQSAKVYAGKYSNGMNGCSPFFKNENVLVLFVKLWHVLCTKKIIDANSETIQVSVCK